MKLGKRDASRAVERPDPAVRLYLFYGPDEAQSRALGARLAETLEASRFLVSAAAIKADPATLADEAAAMSLFGGKRLIWIDPAGDDIAAGAEALLSGGAAESAVVAIGGALRKSSALVKLAEAAPNALALASYPPEGIDAERMIIDAGRRHGLKIAGPVAARIAEACGNDRAIADQELRKLALFVDASPHAPRELDHDALDAVGAESADSNLPRLADLALAGELGELGEELARLPAGTAAIPVVRALNRRLLMLAPIRARVERGERLDAVMTSVGKSLFFKDKALVSKILGRWDAARLATVSERAARLERELLFSDVPEQAALGEELMAIARAAGRSA
ncbi:MAG TPA: DNA polymerase III subunit delta [Sphingomicrobium sp.]|jgi:DNA polymerase-3 subunit delta|nr:DNA polymerase III subunit delta [Sphingomicrobium sp.]